MNLSPVALFGQRVMLEPMNERHADDLLTAASHDDIWEFLDEPTPRTSEQIRKLISDAQSAQARGDRLPFAIIDATTGVAIGSTSYIDIRPQDRGLEIGWTWITPGSWGNGVNTEAKYLLLRYAFEQQDAIRVAIKTDARNVRSKRAIEKLGASFEGVWRNHRILSSGLYRDTAYYSIIASEWPLIRPQIETRLTSLAGQ